MPKRRRGKCVRASRRALATKQEGEKEEKIPNTMVFHRNLVGPYVKQLVADVRNIFMPNTAATLKVQKSNVLKDFVSVAGPLGVTHLVTLTKTEAAVNLRVMKMARGPTLTFKVKEYVLAKDVVSSLKRPVSYQAQFEHPPLLVMNNVTKTGATNNQNQHLKLVQTMFQSSLKRPVSYQAQFEHPPLLVMNNVTKTGATNNQNQHLKLVQTMFQNMFPTISVSKLDVNNVRRCILVDYNHDTQMFQLRHYTIKMVPVGLSKSAKKLAQSKIPKLGGYKDISEYFLQPGQLSESEFEQDERLEVDVTQEMSTRGVSAESGKCAVRLIELGPRINMELLKVEEGLSTGKVLYHRYIEKTPEEIATTEHLRVKKKKLKEKRKLVQAANVKRKEDEKEAHRQRCNAGTSVDDDVPAEDAADNADADDVEGEKTTRRPKFKVRGSVMIKPKTVANPRREKLAGRVLGKMNQAREVASGGKPPTDLHEKSRKRKH